MQAYFMRKFIDCLEMTKKGVASAFPHGSLRETLRGHKGFKKIIPHAIFI